jgi:hypothetical protein
LPRKLFLILLRGRNRTLELLLGFHLAFVRLGAVDESRKIKPTIPAIGEYGIPVRDEIELELRIERMS